MFSDNFSVITIVKDQLSADASQRKITLEINSDLNEESVEHLLTILNPMVQNQYEIAKKYQLIDGIKELCLGEDDLSFLSPEYV